MKRLLFILAILVCGASVLTACMSIDDNAVTKDDNHAKKALLIVLDGWGIGDKGLGDVIAHDIQNCYVHCFMDGRDTDPRAGKGFIADLQQHINQVGTGAIASVIGRFYAMDRDKNWDRILVDVAPSVLHIMGLQQPKEMTGQCLINE